MLTVKEITADLLQNKLDVADLLPDIKFLESVDNMLIKVSDENDKYDTPYSFNKIASLRTHLLRKITRVRENDVVSEEEE